MPLESLPEELQLKIFGNAADDINFTISATPPDEPSQELPFAFSTDYSAAVGNTRTYETHRSAILTHIINEAPIIPVSIVDLNFSNLILLVSTLHAHNQIPLFTLTRDENQQVIIPPRRLEILHTTTRKFPTSTRKVNTFQKFADALAATPLNCDHWMVECQSIRALWNFSANVGPIRKDEGYHVACCVGAVRMHLQEDLREKHEEMLREGGEMADMEDGNGDEVDEDGGRGEDGEDGGGEVVE